MVKAGERGMRNFNIVVVGTGGTGSWLINYLSLLIYSIKETSGAEIALSVIDDDVVEQKNLYRQNFCHADIGFSKAELLARRYGGARGLEIGLYKERISSTKRLKEIFNSSNYDNSAIPVLVGCVDNNEARRLFHKFFTQSSDLVWLDAGNEQMSGQVVMGIKRKGKVYLPPITDLYPDILDKAKDPVSNERCGNIAVTNLLKSSQYFITNITAATTLLNFLYQLLMGMELTVNAADFNIQFCHTKPHYISDLLAISS